MQNIWFSAVSALFQKTVTKKVYVFTDKDCDPYMTDPSTCQGRCPTAPSCNCLTTAKIWSWVPEGLNAKKDWLIVSCKVTQLSSCVIHIHILWNFCSTGHDSDRLQEVNTTAFISAGPLEAFGRVAWQLLQDVQERLVFRAHCYLQSDILQYKPSAGDLAYPEKLEMMEVQL